jgi:AraC-like DNA-binding protein
MAIAAQHADDHRPAALAADILSYPLGGLACVYRHFSHARFPAPQLLAGTGMAADDCASHERRINAWQEYAFVRNLLGQTGDPYVGLAAGNCYRLDTFGVLGAAAESCETAGDALALFLQYLDISFTQFRVDVHSDDDWVHVRFRDCFPLGELRHYFLDRNMACAVMILRDISGAEGEHLHDAIRIRSTRRDAAWAAACTRLTGITPETGADVEAIGVRRGLLAAALPRACATKRQLLEQQCRYESLRRRMRNRSTLERVWQVLAAAGDRIPPIEETARMLAMSERTLRRRLTGEGAGYQGLVDRFREARARELLVTSREAVERIADRLGYSEASAFIHAFKRWTGQTPGAFRGYAH